MNPANKFKKEKEIEIITMYLKGMSQVEIANYYGTFNTSIRRVLLRNKINIRSTAEVQRFVKNNPFKDDEKSDYFLGLLVTDGCISNGCITLGLKEEDVYMLQKYAEFLSPLMKVCKYFHKKHNKFQYQVSFKNKEVCDYLQEKANFHNKSFDLKMYKKLNWNIIRGIIDGDGTYAFSNGGNSLIVKIFSNSFIFTKQVYDFFKENKYNPTITKNKKGLYSVNLNRKKEVINLFVDLYQDADIFLERKYQRMATFVKKFTITNNLNSGKEASFNPERNLHTLVVK